MLVLGPTCLWLQLSHRESLHTSHHCPGQLPSDTAPSSSIMASSTRSTEKILPAASQMRLWRLLLLPRQMMDRPLSNSTEESFSGVIFWWLTWSLNCQSNWQGTGRLMGSLGEGSANAHSPLLLTKPITLLCDHESMGNGDKPRWLMRGLASSTHRTASLGSPIQMESHTREAFGMFTLWFLSTRKLVSEKKKYNKNRKTSGLLSNEFHHLEIYHRVQSCQVLINSGKKEF